MTRPVTTPGRLVAGRYRLQSQIGGGGMGTVWLARDELLGRQVAIKQVLSASGTDAQEVDQQRQRALREGRIAARLSHPHAISVYDVALESGQPWLVMEYLPSRSLAAVLAEDGVLRADQVAQIGAQVADALAATHAAGIVHRDVKPANVLIGQGGRVEGLVKITDFGISHASGDVTLTQTGQITGTPAYLAPEVAQGRPMTEASDVFSLGATLYTCIEGQPPFGVEDNALGMLHRVAGGDIVPPRRTGRLTRPLLRMLAAEPGDRPSMAEIRDELARLAAGSSGDTTTVLLGRTDAGSSDSQRNRTATFGAGAAADGGPPTAPPAPPTAASPPPPRTPTAPPPSGTPRRRRGRGLVIAALVVAILAGLVTAWALVPDPTGDGSDAQGTPSATSATSASATSTPQETNGSGSGAPQPTTAQKPTATQNGADPLTAANIAAFLTDYHQQVLTDPRAAYARTGPTLRNAISEDNYVAYWGQFEDVRIRDIQAIDGQSTATATLELRFRGGGEETGPHRFTFLVENGRLILDSDVPA
jgi:serine/threonine protein kinase